MYHDTYALTRLVQILARKKVFMNHINKKFICET